MKASQLEDKKGVTDEFVIITSSKENEIISKALDEFVGKHKTHKAAKKLLDEFNNLPIF